MAVKDYPQRFQELRARRRGGVDDGRVDAGGVGVRVGSEVASGGEASGDDRRHLPRTATVRRATRAVALVIATAVTVEEAAVSVAVVARTAGLILGVR